MSEPRRDLSETTKGLLRGSYGERAIPQAFMSAVHGMIAAGREFEEIRDYFRTRTVTLAKDVRLHYQSNLDTELEAAFNSAVEYRGAHRKACGVARGAIAHLWRGSEGSAFRTLMGLYDLSEVAGRLEFTASRRQVAEAAGLGGLSNNQASYTTSANAVSRLHEMGMICFDAYVHRRGERNANSTYRLHPPDRLQEALRESFCTPIPYEDKSSSLALLWSPTTKTRGIDPFAPIPLNSTWQHPVWEPAGLGVTPCRVWHRLDADAASAKRVAESLGVSAQSVRTALRRLAEYGLTSRQVDGTHATTPLDLDDVAETVGVADRSARRAELNSLHRAQRETLLNRPRTDRPAPRHQILDPFTGEIFDVVIMEAATVLLGGPLI